MIVFGKHGFRPLGVTFDGSNDYTSRNADHTGAADGKNGLISLWFKLNGGDGTLMVIYGNDGNDQEVRRNADNTISIVAASTGIGDDLLMVSNSTYTDDDSWHHLLCAYNVATGTKQLYIDGADDLAAGSTSSNDNLDYTHANHLIGARSGGGNKFNGDLSEVYINLAATMDISTAANRELFIRANRPSNMGSDGSIPTGTAPICYFSARHGDAAAAFATNRGTGEGYTETGALVLSDDPAL